MGGLVHAFLEQRVQDVLGNRGSGEAQLKDDAVQERPRKDPQILVLVPLEQYFRVIARPVVGLGPEELVVVGYHMRCQMNMKLRMMVSTYAQWSPELTVARGTYQPDGSPCRTIRDTSL
jgi:hypothetical protein